MSLLSTTASCRSPVPSLETELRILPRSPPFSLLPPLWRCAWYYLLHLMRDQPTIKKHRVATFHADVELLPVPFTHSRAPRRRLAYRSRCHHRELPTL